MDRIMIIDSDLSQMRELNNALFSNYQILNCSRGSKALELFRIFQPAALVMDPKTFEMKAQSFIKQARYYSLKRLPVLALTRITNLQQIEENFDLGVDIIFSKPCAVELVQKKLRALLAALSSNLQPNLLEA